MNITREGRPEDEGSADREPAARVTLRLPKSLKLTLESLAERDGVTLNTFVIYLCSVAAGRKLERQSRSYPIPDMVDFAAAQTTSDLQRTINEATAVAHGLLAQNETVLAVMLFSLLADRTTSVLGAERSAGRLGKAARAALDAGLPQVAEEFWKKALSIDPSNRVSCAAYGLFLFERRRYIEAVQYLESAGDRESSLRLLWSRLYLTYDPFDAARNKTSLQEIFTRLEDDSRDSTDLSMRAHWVNNVTALKRLPNPEAQAAVLRLLDFANKNSRWAKVRLEELN